MDQFTELYQLSKTLRFELKPIGQTLENITRNGVLVSDSHRADSYQKVKMIIDTYHKVFIEDVLKATSIPIANKGGKDSLEEFIDCYSYDSSKERLAEIQDKLRKYIVTRFKQDARYNNLTKKELIEKDLVNFVDEESKSILKEFKGFTTYFTGFNENRKNLYSEKEQSSSIAYRLINENLPKFIDNITAFKIIAESPVSAVFDQLFLDFSKYLSVTSIYEIFQLKYFNTVLTQKQIDVYNAILGGKTIDERTKIKGLNEYINLYNQKQKDKSRRLPRLKPLFKLILSDRGSISWLPENFSKDEDVLNSIENAYRGLQERVLNKNQEGEQTLKELLKGINNFDLTKIYIKNDAQISELSQKVFGHWDIITKGLINDLKNSVPKRTKRETDDDYEDRLFRIYKEIGSISIAQINNCVHKLYPGINNTLQEYFASFGNKRLDSGNNINLFDEIDNAYNNAKELLNVPYSGKNLSLDKINVEKIKNLLDSIKSLQYFVKPLLGDGTEGDKDISFYNEFNILWTELDKMTQLYNKVRNYITRKPYSIEKIKLNFDNSKLMDGWDVNKEQDNTAVILRKDGLYYLAIMNKKYNSVFNIEAMPTSVECYEKMEYKQLQNPYLMLPKVFFSKSRIEEFSPSSELITNYEKGTHKKGINFNIEHCHNLIDFYKSSIIKNNDWRRFNFEFSETSAYEDLNDFYREVEQQGYNITFRNVPEEYIDSLVEEGKIYLFLIYNKDFSPYSKGTPNLHTLYWKMLFDERNLTDVVYKLNGKAEIFFRQSSINEEQPTHPAYQPIANKNQLNNKKNSIFKYDLIKDKRYKYDKFLFHVPITINFKSTGNKNINIIVNDYIKNNNDIHIIGIDRGERHLLYLTVIDKKGNIKEQYSLNEIINHYNGNEYRTDYHDLLTKCEDARLSARKSWQTIESIKDLKEGYLSQVIHKIAELMIRYKAIVVLEDLNYGFKRSRQKVESSVYQKFEKMLIDKLNFLVDKKKDPQELGGILKAYQLTNKFESFQKLGKQCGFLFYAPAWNTSKIDPVTGFVNLLDTRYESREKARDFFCKFDNISYNKEKDWFEFAFDYTNFTTKANGTRTKWILCTYGKRIETYRNPLQNSQWVSKELILTDCLKTFFDNYGIDINSNLKECIIAQQSTEFYKGLLNILRLTLQMRNSKSGTDIDYLQSPVADENGIFYNSDECSEELPKNSDANGAYNIARKGLWIVQQIKESKDFTNIKLTMSNKEWLKFAQEKPYLNI